MIPTIHHPHSTSSPPYTIPTIHHPSIHHPHHTSSPPYITPAIHHPHHTPSPPYITPPYITPTIHTPCHASSLTIPHLSPQCPWTFTMKHDLGYHVNTHNEKVMCETCSATYYTRTGLCLHKMKICCWQTAINLSYIYYIILTIFIHITPLDHVKLIVNWLYMYNVRLCGWYCILLCYYKLCWIHNYYQVNDNYIIFYCAMAIL